MDFAYAMDENFHPVFWDAIKKGQYDCANMLLHYPRSEGCEETFRRRGGDLLLWAIENDTYESVSFILEKLLEKHVTVGETQKLLSTHLCTIGERRPEMLADLLKNDKFTIEYARFRVPKAVFDINSKIPKTMITRTIPASLKWEVIDGERGKGLWIKHWEEEGHSIDSTSDAQTSVIAKIFFIDCPVHLLRNDNTMGQHLCEYLNNLSMPVEAFESETLKKFIDHWFQVFRPLYQVLRIQDIVATLIFTIFSLTFGPSNEIGKFYSLTWPYMLSVSASLRAVGAYHLGSCRRSATTRLLVLSANV